MKMKPSRGEGQRGRVGGGGGDRSRKSYAHHQAGGIVSELLRAKEKRRGGASIKSLVYANDIQSKKQVYALCCETLRHLELIKEVLRRAKFSLGPHKSEKTADGDEGSFVDTGAASTRKACVVYVWVYELLFGRWDGIQEGRRFAPVASKESSLREAHKVVMADTSSGKSPAPLTPTQQKVFPRYVRVNTLKIQVDEALRQLVEEYGEESVKKNPYLDDVIELPPNVTDFYGHRLVRGGSLVQQGLSSCMPVHALEPLGGDWTLIDACSAPGNKTTQLAAHLASAGEAGGCQGKIFAFDLDPIRFERLRKNVRHCGAGRIVTPELRDFLGVDPSKEERFREVRGILLDPSCSGSGTVHSRGDYLIAGGSKNQERTEQDKRRVDTLASFQEKCLRHALSFPKVERVVYSTCSIHVRENEQVVASVLAEAERLGFELERALPQWPRRGFPLFEGCDNLVRVNPNKDKTDGFFLALFVRAPR